MHLRVTMVGQLDYFFQMKEDSCQTSVKHRIKNVVGIALILVISAVALGIVFSHLFPGPQSKMGQLSPVAQIVVAIAAAPLVETAMLALSIEWCLKKKIGSRFILALIAVGFGFLHMESVTWGAHAIVAFFIMARVYLRLTQESRWTAYWNVTAIHALANVALVLINITVPE